MTWYQRTIRRIASSLLTAFVAVAVSAGVLSAGEPASDGRDLKTLSIEELMAIEVQTVTSTSKYPQKVTEAPSSVTIITADEIRKYGYRTLADILKSVRGFFVTNDRTATYLGVRGFARPGDLNTRVLLLVDGHRINDNISDTATIGNEFGLDIDLIDRVEISRGPSSSLYGSNAFFAVVNVITRRGADLNGTEASGEAASFGTRKGRVSYGKKWQDGSEALISGTAYDSRGDRLYFPEFDPGNPYHDPRAGNNGVAEYRDGERFSSAFATWTAQGLTLQGALISRAKGIPSAANGADFNNGGNRVTDQRAYGDVTYDRSLGQQSAVTARAYYDSAMYRADYVYSGIVNQDSSSGAWFGGELKLSTKVYDIHRLMLGAEYDDNRQQDQRNADQMPFSRYLDDERSSRTWAAYIQDEITFSPSAILNAGVRYDQTSFSGSSTNPRIALIFTPAAGSTVKLLYGSAFRSPNVHELYYQTAASSPPVIANPDLKPEKIETSEVVYEQYFRYGLRVTVDGYYYKIDDLINQTVDPSGRLVFKNIDEVEAKGLELELEKRWTGGASGHVNYALQRATNSRTGDVLTNSPEQLARLNVTVPFLAERVFAGIEEQYISRRKTDSGGFLGENWMTNLTLLGRNASRTVEVSASVYNLFNVKTSDPASPDLAPLTEVPQDGRTLRVKLTYAF